MKAGILSVAFCCVAGFVTGLLFGGSWVITSLLALSVPITIGAYMLLERWRKDDSPKAR